jgi:tRNA(fMet)-specific endonuclease VapC
VGFIIDSGVIIHAERKGLSLHETLREYATSECFLSVITLSELLHGVERATTAKFRQERIQFLTPIIARYPIISIDEETARVHAVIWADLLARGEIIGLHDLWIAASCIRHGHTIVTSNEREFNRVPGLMVKGLR